MKKSLTILYMLFSFGTLAQASNSITITLQQAKELGLKNRYDAQADKYNIAIAGNNLKKAKNDWLPDISASGNLKYNTQLQATMIPAGFGGFEEPQLLALGANNVSIFGLDLNQPIYKPVMSTDVKLARNNEAMQKEKNRQNEIYIKNQVAQAYLNVQLKKLQLKIAEDNEQRYKDYYAVADATYKAGSLLENDLLKARLDHENAKTTTETERQQVIMAFNNLKYQLNVPDNTDLILADSFIADGESVVNGDEMNRTEIKQLQLQQQYNRLQAQRINCSNLPTVALFANYSQQFLNNKFEYTERKWWTPFSYVGLRINLPITGIYKSTTYMRENKLQSKQTDLLLQQKTADVHYEIQNATTTLNNARRNMHSVKGNYELSQTIYSTQKQQYKYGVLQYSNLLDTEKSLSTAEQNYVKAVYDYLVARIGYEKANGSL